MDKLTPGTSYIIITNNAVLAMQEEVERLQSQAEANWQCIILDNGSEDHTGFVARKLVDRDARIRYVYQQKQAVEIAQQNALAVCIYEQVQVITFPEI